MLVLPHMILRQRQQPPGSMVCLHSLLGELTCSMNTMAGNLVQLCCQLAAELLMNTSLIKLNHLSYNPSFNHTSIFMVAAIINLSIKMQETEHS